ncbi:MAG TPA: hypothetical protein VKT28_17315 [Puia sp.]|nr:hypothetical protein [Puia sp.]
MKTRFGLFGIGAITVLAILNSCGKSNSDQPKTKMQLITASVWKYDTAGIDLNNDGTIDAAIPPGYIKDCQTDNLLYFKSDSTGTEDEGATKCDPSNPQTASFTWSFNSSQTIINFPDSVFGSVGGSVNITSLTETQLHFEKTITQSGITATVAVYMKH